MKPGSRWVTGPSAQGQCHGAQALSVLSRVTSSQGCREAEGPGGEKVPEATRQGSVDLYPGPRVRCHASFIPHAFFENVDGVPATWPQGRSSSVITHRPSHLCV